MKKAMFVPILILGFSMIPDIQVDKIGAIQGVPNPETQRLWNVGRAGGNGSGLLPIAPDFGNVPLYFIPNRGQVDDRVLAYAKTPRYTLWVTRDGFVFDAAVRDETRADPVPEIRSPGALPEDIFKHGPSGKRGQAHPSLRDVSRLIFLGSQPAPDIQLLEPARTTINSFIGCDPEKWKTDIPTSRAIRYQDIYPGIDLKVYGVENRVEYDWIARPGARLEDIRFAYKDIRSSGIDGEGNLIVETPFGRIVHHKPASYQWINHEKVEVESKFKKVGEDTYGFSVEDYDRLHDLIIDPILVYSTYLGGSGDDYARDIAVDGTGAAYVVGWTAASDFPLKNSFQNTRKGSQDVFITKFSPSGKAIAYSTFLGGAGDDYGYGISVDSSGSAYVTGQTTSSDFPLQNPHHEYSGGGDIFVTKLSPAGNALDYSTCLNAPCTIAYDIAVDDLGAAYVTGVAWSVNLPVKNPFQDANRGSFDAFLTKLTPAGNDLVYSTWLGGKYWDESFSVAVDSSYCAYVAGFAASPDFPLQNPYQNKNKGSVEAFVTKFSAAGNTLVYSTYLGGSWWDWCYEIRVDRAGAAYLTGETYSRDFPVKNAYQKKLAGLLDIFVTKLAPAGNAITYSTFLGGSNYEEAGSLAIDGSGNIYVTGETYSPDFPLQNPYKKTVSGGDVFVTKFASSGTTLVYSTLLGGSQRDRATGIAVDGKGGVYVVGETYSSDFPLQSAYQKKNAGGWDAFVAKLNLSQPGVTVTSPNGGETRKAGSSQTIRWDYTGNAGTAVKIELMKGKSLDTVIATGALIGKNGKGSYQWKILLNQDAGDHYRIRITSKKSASLTDTSDADFSISN